MADESKIKGAIRIGSAVASTTSAVTTLKNARLDKDQLALVNAIALIVAAITGFLLGIRNLRGSKR